MQRAARTTFEMNYLLGCLALLHYVRTTIVDDIIVRTHYGDVRGKRAVESYELGAGKVTDIVDQFYGIPFARPPVGALRFQPPQPPEPWSSTKDARQFGAVCPQIVITPGTETKYQDEDCLNLNIFSPYQESAPDQTYPVMVYIHGGSYEVGSGKLYDGTVLAQFGVVVVTINYRLGALGFMTSGDGNVTGNYGLMDQVAALQWVRDNIEAFRGNPGRVTLLGHSAGGACVGILLVVPKANGLFHGVIAQSGSAVSAYSVRANPYMFRNYVRDVGMLFDCDQETIEDIVNCLRLVPSQQFIEKRRHFPLYDPIDPEFRPFLDGTWVVGEPRELFQSGQFNKLPLITGTVQDEFGNYFRGGARALPGFDAALDHYVCSQVKNSDMVEVVKYIYTDWTEEPSRLYDRGALLSDMQMVAPTVDLAELVVRFHPDIYQYHFSTEDCYHSAELNYVFGAPYSGIVAAEMDVEVGVTFTPEQQQHSVFIMTLWTNFAKYSVPTLSSGSSDTDAISWRPFTTEEKGYLHLSPHNTTMSQRLRQDKVHFWNNLVYKMVKDGSDTYDEPAFGARSQKNHDYSINLWVFLAITGILFALALLFAILFYRTRKAKNESETRRPRPDIRPTLV